MDGRAGNNNRILSGQWRESLMSVRQSGRNIPFANVIFDAIGKDSGIAVVLTTAGKVFATPLQIDHPVIVNRIAIFIRTVTAGNVRVGIYRDMGNTPAGGALIVESASTAAAAGSTCQEIAIADTYLDRGIYWLVVQSDTTTLELQRASSSFYSTGTLNGKTWANTGAYAAFENPQSSAITASQSVPTMAVKVTTNFG